MTEAPKPKRPRKPKNKLPKVRTRPTHCTPELITKIAGAIEAGFARDNAMLGLGVAPASITEWIFKGRNGIPPYSDLVLAIEEAKGKSHSRVEKQLAKAISKGAPWAIQFYLKCRDPENYNPATRAELSGPNNAPLEVSLQGLSTDELLKLASSEDDTND